MPVFKIVETCNFGGDYPNERFLTVTDSEGKSTPLVCTNEKRAEAIADMLNGPFAEDNPRWWKVVPSTYILQPGFEP